MEKECRAPPPPARSSTRVRWCVRALLSPFALLLPTACGGVQSALDPAGTQAELIATLFWIMAAGAVLVWLGVIAFAIYATLVDPGRHSVRISRRIIIGGGVVLPVIVLTALLVPGLALLPELRSKPADDGLKVEVSGEQWWWRVTYRPVDGAPVTMANEVRLPFGETVEFVLTSPDVIHSFWIPALAGKVDMTPGRMTRLVVTPNRTGIFRGACAEYCGESHARMSFHAVVMPPDEFARWLKHQRADAAAPANDDARRGQRAFLSNGCGACHTIRGTRANGTVGPDLTHVGSRLALAAATLPNDTDAFRRFIAHANAVKPAARMPRFDMLPHEDIEAIAHYLDGLE